MKRIIGKILYFARIVFGIFLIESGAIGLIISLKEGVVFPFVYVWIIFMIIAGLLIIMNKRLGYILSVLVLGAPYILVMIAMIMVMYGHYLRIAIPIICFAVPLILGVIIIKIILFAADRISALWSAYKKKIITTLAFSIILFLGFFVIARGIVWMDINKGLREAVSYGDIDVAKLMIKRGADANTDNGYPLKMAVIRLNSDLVRLLIKEGAEINKVDREEWTPLMYVAIPDVPYPYDSRKEHWKEYNKRRLEIMRILLEGGADANIRNNRGITAIGNIITTDPYGWQDQDGSGLFSSAETEEIKATILCFAELLRHYGAQLSPADREFLKNPDTPEDYVHWLLGNFEPNFFGSELGAFPETETRERKTIITHLIFKFKHVLAFNGFDSLIKFLLALSVLILFIAILIRVIAVIVSLTKPGSMLRRKTQSAAQKLLLTRLLCISLLKTLSKKIYHAQKVLNK